MTDDEQLGAVIVPPEFAEELAKPYWRNGVASYFHRIDVRDESHIDMAWAELGRKLKAGLLKRLENRWRNKHRAAG